MSGISGTYRLRYNAVDAGTCVDVTASDNALATYISTLVNEARGYVTVVTFGGVKYVRFVDTHPRTYIPQLSLGNQGGCTTLSSSASVLINYELNGYPRATFNHHYVALRPGTQYYVRVTARNARGYGYSSGWVPATTAALGVAPSPPSSLTLGVDYTATSLSLVYEAPLASGGLVPLTYRVEYDTSPTFSSAQFRALQVARVDEVQYVRTFFEEVTGNLGGTFTLTLNGQTSPPLAYNILPDVLAVQLQLLVREGWLWVG
jgi:hypothetical protein